MRRALSIATNGTSVSRGPPSPTSSQTTNASVLDLGNAGYAASIPTTHTQVPKAKQAHHSPQRIVTRGDLRASAQAYAELLHSASMFTDALKTLSKASASYASSIERCARLKGAGDDTATALQSSSGLFFILCNHLDVLVRTPQASPRLLCRLTITGLAELVGDREIR